MKNHATAEQNPMRKRNDKCAALHAEAPDTADLPKNDSEQFFEESLKQFQEASFDAALAKSQEDEDFFAEDPVSEKQQDAESVPAAAPVRKKTIGAAGAFGIAAAVCALCFGTILGVLFYMSRPVTIGLYETVPVRAADLPLLSVFCRTDADPKALDTSYPHDTSLPMTFFGVIERNMQVHVCDLEPPEFSVADMTVMCRTALEAQDCVVSCEDQTAVSFSFETEPDLSVSGVQPMTVLAADEGGNQAKQTLVLHVEDIPVLQAELGSTEEALASMIRAQYPALAETEIDLSSADLTRSGICRASADTADGRYLLTLTLADTTAPVGRPHNFTLLPGKTLTPESFVTEISDRSPVTLSYQTAPDYDLRRPQTVAVAAEDSEGNRTVYECGLEILDVQETLTLECGTTADQFRDLLFASLREQQAEEPQLSSAFDPQTAAPGTYDVALRGKYGLQNLSVTMQDTVAPVLKTKSLTAYIGHMPEAEDFCEEITDATAVTVTMTKAPDVSFAQTVTVALEAADAAGNRTTAHASLTVIADTEPPVIHGVQTIYVKEGGTASYRASVFAEDNADGKIRVSVDASHVNTKVCGTYFVKYTAKDRAGNEAVRRARVIVSGVNQESIDAYCDEILAYIIRNGMTERERAEAVYNWCVRNIRYSSAASDLMGQFIPAAYAGFSTHTGNCYTYYAVAASLLTRTGLENIEIHRSSTTRPHYWNMVKIDGSWYHFDSCPQEKKHRIRAFLLTDADLAAYNRDHIEGYYSFDASAYPATP